MNLLTIPLSGRVEGIEVNRGNTWTGHRNVYTYDENEYDGIRFKGEGRGKTAIVSNGVSNMTVNIGRGRVLFEGLTIEGSERCAVATSWAGGPDVYLGLTDVEGVFEVGRWGLFLYNTDDYIIGSDFYGGKLGEHVRYGHGFAEKGSIIQGTNFHESGAENDKQANRPEEGTRHRPGARMLREDCRYGGWQHPDSGSGMGGGIVFQGTSADIMVNRCVFDAPSWVYSKSLMIDDGYGTSAHHGSRFYDFHTGQPQPKDNPNPDFCANGRVSINDCLFSGHGPDHYGPMVRCGPMQPVEHATAVSFEMSGCGVYGPKTKVELSNLESGVRMLDNNTPELREACLAQGFDVSEETVLAYQGAFHEIGGDFELSERSR